MIKIKVKRQELSINIGDTFLDNGSVIILMSQKIYSSGTWNRMVNPAISKKAWKELQNKLEFTKSNYGTYTNMFLYKVVGVK